MLFIQKSAERKWAYSNLVSVVSFHLMTYLDFFIFFENTWFWLE